MKRCVCMTYNIYYRLHFVVIDTAPPSLELPVIKNISANKVIVKVQNKSGDPLSQTIVLFASARDPLVREDPYSRCHHHPLMRAGGRPF